MDHKKCPKCGQIKPITDFGIRAASKDGRAKHCLECAYTMGKEYKRRRRAQRLSEHCYLYVLIDPRDAKPHYVGIAKNYRKRYSEHLREARSGAGVNVAKNEWISSIFSDGLEPVMVCVAEGEEETMRELERGMIKLFIEQRMDIVNDQGYEKAAKIAAKPRGKKYQRI